MFVRAFLLKISCLVFFFGRHADGQGGNSIKEVISVPDRPVLNTQISINCKASIKCVSLQLLVQNKEGSNLAQFRWVKKPKADLKKEPRKWKNPDECRLTTSKSAEDATLSLHFKATRKDMLNYQCTCVLETYETEQKTLSLTIMVPPKVIALSVVPKVGKDKDGVVISPGQERSLNCTVTLGSPEPTNGVVFTAPGNGTSKFRKSILKEEKGEEKIYQYVLDRVFDFKDNGRTSYCEVRNEAGRSSKALTIDIKYAPRNTVLSISRNANVSVGDEITCTSNGNPSPRIRITVSGYGEKDKDWAGKGASGLGKAKIYIPHTASLGKYSISCNASNNINYQVVKQTAFNLIAAPPKLVDRTESPLEIEKDYQSVNQTISAASYASAGIIGGIILGLLVLVILVAIICFVVQRRQNTTAKQERPMNHPVLMFKSGSQGSYPGDRYQQTALFHPSSRGSNGEQQFIERGDTSVDEESAPNEHSLNYASLDFDETPRSRMPIVFKDSDKVEYSEIVSPPYNNSYDEDHYYENVRHNVV